MGVDVLFSVLAIIVVAGGVGKWPDLRLPVVDTVAQALSLGIAYNLFQHGSSCGRSLAAILAAVAAGIAACHATSLNSSSLIWTYLDGADYALWASIAVCGIIKAVGVYIN